MIFDRAQVAAALPGYDLGGELGSGTFGLVLEGRHRSLGRTVAIKIARLPDADGRQFSSEARLLARVQHPHVVHVYDYVERAGLAIIVMEHLPGGSLKERVEDGVTAVDACAVVVAIALACESVHEAGVLHRDIKPGNILFGADGTPKLTDFGIAKIVFSTYATASRAIGSTPYMAPEQFRAEQLSRATDVYALGAVLYELLAGRPPFGRDGEDRVMANRHAFATVPALHTATAVPAIPEAVAAVVDRALSKQAAARQPTAARFADELARAAASAFGPGWLADSGVLVRADGLRHPASPVVGPTRRIAPGEPVGTAGDGDGLPGVRILPGGGGGPVRPPGTSNGHGHRDGSGAGIAGRAGGVGERERRRRWVTVLVAGCLAVAVAVAGLVAMIVSVTSGDGEDDSYYTTWEEPLTVRLAGWVGLAVDGRGRLFVTDSSRHTLIMMTPGRAHTTIIGSERGVDEPSPGLPGRGEWEPADRASLYRPGGVAVASDGTVFVADTANCVVRVLREQGPGEPDAGWEVGTVAGMARTDMDDGRARDLERDCPAPPPRGPRSRAPASGEIGTPVDVAVDGEDNLYIATGYAGQLWVIDRHGEWSNGNNPYSARPRLVAGTADVDPRHHEPVVGFGKPSTAQRTEADAVGLDNVYSVAVAPGGDVYLASKINKQKTRGGTDRIHVVDEDGFISTFWNNTDEVTDIKDIHVAGDRVSVLYADGASRNVLATAGGDPTHRVDTSDFCSGITGVTTDGAGNIFMSCRVRGLEGARILVFDADRGGIPRVIAE